jgi:hypothetical protein
LSDWSIGALLAKGAFVVSSTRWLWRRWRHPDQPSIVTRCWRVTVRIVRPHLTIQELLATIYSQSVMIESQKATIGRLEDICIRQYGSAFSPTSPEGDQTGRRTLQRDVQDRPPSRTYLSRSDAESSGNE